ncbi:hypothetical protein DVH05_026362 [Phytophthora capsici]|nr:hypothetical protein DVH05_026362 [Phytophthora capsici]
MPSNLRVASCSFLRLGCRNDQHELFSASYARSNKKRNAKLLRCFPHCCPSHVERSYCGSSLHTLVTFQSDEDAVAANDNEDLVVCARFEAVAAVALPGGGNGGTPLPLESITALPSCALRAGGSASESDWVLGEKTAEMYQQQLPKNTILYLFNNRRNPQWYYGYDSGSTKAHRELKHVFAVYVFQLYRPSEHQAQQNSNYESGGLRSAARLATVAVRHASPSFTIISYRRLNDTRRCKKRIEKEQQAIPSAAKPEPNVIVPRKTTSQTNTGSSSQQDVRDIHGTNSMELQNQPRYENVDGLERQRSTPAAPPLGLQKALHCPICSSPLSHRSHHLLRHSLPKTVEDLQLLLVLHNFMSSTPLDAFTFHFGRMDFRIQCQWLASLSSFAQARQHGSAMRFTASEMITSLASKFSLAQFVPDVVQSDMVAFDPVREQKVLQLCADLLLDTCSSSRIQRIVNQVCVGQDFATQGTVSPSGSCERFCRLVAEFIDELTRLLQAQTKRNGEDPMTILSLVDEILSLIYGENKYQSLREKTSSLLLRRDESLEIAMQALYRSLPNKPCRTLDSPLLSTASVDGKGSPSNERLSSGVWNNRWFVDPLSITVLPLSQANTSESSTSFSTPSLLSVITLLRMFASVDISVESSRVTVVAAMADGTSGTELVLDGQPHMVDSLPNGLSAVAGAALLGGCRGEYQYQGFISDDGSSIELLFVSLSASLSSRIVSSWKAQRVHLLLELDESRGCGGKGFIAVVEVSSASVDRNLSDHLLTDDISDNISTWTPTMEVHATYTGI